MRDKFKDFKEAQPVGSGDYIKTKWYYTTNFDGREVLVGMLLAKTEKKEEDEHLFVPIHNPY